MRYKLFRTRNPETHSYGDAIFVKDEDGHMLDVCFENEDDALDYIKLNIEKDLKYKAYIENPENHIMDLYGELNNFSKKQIQNSLIVKYRNKCKNESFV